MNHTDLLDCAQYHQDYAKGLLQPVSALEDESAKLEYRRKATRHQKWAQACRQANYILLAPEQKHRLLWLVIAIETAIIVLLGIR